MKNNLIVFCFKILELAIFAVSSVEFAVKIPNFGLVLLVCCMILSDCCLSLVYPLAI